jgi:PKD repeat protein
MFVAVIDETDRHRPVPLGVSIGHPDITAGTLGFKVKDDEGSYILSNNHVMANTNKASIGDAILQPGPFDGGSEANDKIATLEDFVDIDFAGNDNFVDAAIAKIVPGVVVLSESEGYGKPSVTPAEAYVGLPVVKHGRTTGETFGTVIEVNATVRVCYKTQGPFRCKESALFKEQIFITDTDTDPNDSFSAGGDSGSGIVTSVGNNPVGLLFAGSSIRTIANPIGLVLSELQVEIDDGNGGSSDPGNSPPTASFTFDCTDLACDFDGSNSFDLDGSGLSWGWNFGDGQTGSGETINHIYETGGSYTVTLTVTDDDAATGVESQGLSVSGPATGQHVGDLDGSSQNDRSTWTASVTITVHDAPHVLVGAGVSVIGSWAGAGTESGNCVTSDSGQCTVTLQGIRKRNGSVTYTITSPSEGNHDPDGDSDGTTITVLKP